MMRIDFYNNNYNKQNPNFSGRKLSVTKTEIETLILQGKSPKEIAEQFGHRLDWCYWIMKKFGLDSLRKSLKNTFEEQVIDLRKNGATINTIAEKLNVSTNRIVGILKKIDIKKTRKDTSVKITELPERNCLIKEELSKGLSAKEVAEKTGFSLSAIRYIGRNMDKNQLKIARNQLKNNRVQEVAISLIDDLKIGDNVHDFIENSEKFKNADFKVGKQALSKTLCQLKDEKYTKLVAELLKAGFLISEIANKINCSVSTAAEYANKAGFRDKRKQYRIHFKEQIINLLNRGKKLKEIANELNCSSQSIYNYMGNKSWKHLRKVYLQNREKEIYELHLNGVSQKEIAQKFNISEDTVKRNIKRYQS